MAKQLISVCVVLGVLVASCSGAKILGFFGIPSISHQVVYRAYMRELAKQGHNVTIITTDPIKKDIANYTEIDLHYAYDTWRKHIDVASDGGWLMRNMPEFLVLKLIGLLTDFCEIYLSDPNVKKIIESGEQFDAFVVEFGPLPCTYPFVKQSNNLLIGVMSLSYGNIVHKMYGSAPNAAYSVEAIFPYSTPLTILEKTRTIISEYFLKFVSIGFMMQQKSIAEKHFPQQNETIFDLAYNVSLLMQHTHPSSYFSRPQTAIFVDIGGPPLHLHGQDIKPLPQVGINKVLILRSPSNVFYFNVKLKSLFI